MARVVRNLPTKQETWIWSLVGKIPWSRKWQPTPIFLTGKSHAYSSLVGYSPWGHKESDRTEQLSMPVFTSNQDESLPIPTSQPQRPVPTMTWLLAQVTSPKASTLLLTIHTVLQSAKKGIALQGLVPSNHIEVIDKKILTVADPSSKKVIKDISRTLEQLRNTEY